MKPGGQLRRLTSLRRGDSQLARTALSPVSARRRGGGDKRAAVRAAVFARDRCCVPAMRGVPGPCFGHWTVHHLRKASGLGGYVEDNLVQSCAFHNDYIEDHPAEATRLGLVIR